MWGDQETQFDKHATQMCQKSKIIYKTVLQTNLDDRGLVGVEYVKGLLIFLTRGPTTIKNNNNVIMMISCYAILPISFNYCFAYLCFTSRRKSIVEMGVNVM